MKKLMIVAAVAIAASFANAATGNWGTGAVYFNGVGSQLKDSSGGASTKVGEETTTYLFAGLTAGQYGALTDAKTIFSIFTEGDTMYPDVDEGKLAFGEDLGGTVSSVDAWNFGDGNNYAFDDDTDYTSSPVYAALVTLVHDEDGKVIAYSANTMYGTFEEGALKMTNVDKAALGWGEGATGTATTWQSVPEPTSGLLLLLGVAGLALRRRRA